MPTYTLSVGSVTTSKDPRPVPKGTKPEHWVDAAGHSFANPWKSFKPHSFSDRFKLLPTMITSAPTPPKDLAKTFPIHKPDWGLGPASEGKPNAEYAANEQIKATWLGHACFLVELPSRDSEEGGRGVRILFDPVFSDRCSPSQVVGPKRFTPPPCRIEDIPEVDAVVISHNHYDHLDTHTIQTLVKRHKRVPHFFAPLGNGPYFKSVGVPVSNTHILDWWETKRVEIANTSSNQDGADKSFAAKRVVDITCTPGQHFTGRTLWDTFHTLWAGWAAEEVLSDTPVLPDPNSGPAARPPVKVYFGGDTAYRTVMDGENEDEVPFCPAFQDIGNVFGSFDLGLIPIGAYMPREFMSRIHCAPQDSVRLFKDVKAKKALGMHWGTWILTTEDVTEPPRRLAEECKKIGIEDGAFVTCEIGQTLFF